VGQERSFVRSVGGVLGTNFGVAALSLLNVVVVARALGPTGRGDVAFLTTVTNLTHYLATFGVQEANANLGTDRRLRPALATNSVILAALFGGLGALAVLVLVELVPAAAAGADRRLLLLSLAAIPILVLGRYLRLLANAQYAFAVTNVAWLATPVVAVATNAVLAAAGLLTVGLAVVAWLAGQVVATLIVVVHAARESGFGRPDRALARRCTAFGLRSHAGQTLLLGNYRLDQWLVGSLAGARELGLYSVAVAGAETLFYLPTALASVQRPDLVRSAPRVAVERARTIARAALVVTVPLVVALVIVAPYLVDIVFGASFDGAVDDLRVLAVGSLGVVTIKLLVDALTAQGRPLRASAGIAVGFVTMVVLDVVLIPPHGGLGAAIAASTSYLVGGAAVAVLFTRADGGSTTQLVPGRSDLSLVLSSLRPSRR
jgi:O-antigen/teichoic acid export membrane protein